MLGVLDAPCLSANVGRERMATALKTNRLVRAALVGSYALVTLVLFANLSLPSDARMPGFRGTGSDLLDIFVYVLPLACAALGWASWRHLPIYLSVLFLVILLILALLAPGTTHGDHGRKQPASSLTAPNPGASGNGSLASWLHAQYIRAAVPEHGR